MFALRLLGTTGQFLVRGTGARESGGTISDVETGAILEGNATVALSSVLFEDNQTAVASRDNEVVQLYRIDVNNSESVAIKSVNDETLIITESEFADNGALGDATVEVGAGVYGNYQSSIAGNFFTNGNGPAVFVTSTSTDAPSALVEIHSNDFNVSRDNLTAVDVDWYGPLGISIYDNEFNMDGNSAAGVSLASLSADNRLEASVSQNIFNFASGNGIGIDLNAAGGSEVSIYGNLIEFDGSNGTGVKLTFQQTTSLAIESNHIVDNVSGGTAILCEDIAADSTVAFSNNWLQLLSSGSAIDEGIIFEHVEATISLSSEYDNVIEGASRPFIIPAGTSTGGFYINGTFVE